MHILTLQHILIGMPNCQWFKNEIYTENVEIEHLSACTMPWAWSPALAEGGE
jgi:hypothetical protein